MDLWRQGRRWLAAEQAGQEAEADAALGDLFASMPRVRPSGSAADAVIRTLATAPLPGRSAVRWSRVAGAATIALVAIVAGYAFVTAAVPLATRGFVIAIELVARTFVWIMLAFESGLGVWGVLAAIGGRLGELLATPRVTMLLVVVELVGAAALYALHRMLASDKESV